MTLSTENTVRDVVVEDFRTAAVFQRYGLDFCCGGGASISRACKKKGVKIEELMTELTQTMQENRTDDPRFSDWSPPFLIDYIVQNHHGYVRNAMPVIRQHAEKVAKVHGPARESLVTVAKVFDEIATDLEAHMYKEEEVLFPYIKQLAEANENGTDPGRTPFGTVQNPIRMMEAEHRQAGDEMARIRELTDNYTPPMDACMTYRVLFQELQDFEQDLHKHVHLENNILFPKAVEVEETMSGEAPTQCEIPN